MKYRKLGATEIFVSEIGFGAWGIGGLTPGATSYGTTNDAVSQRALSSAFEHGVTFFDTSNVYGAGHSEKLIGKVFSTNRQEVIIATKGGLNTYTEPPDFSPKNLLESLHASLTRLNTDYIDLYQLHNPPSAIITKESGIGQFIRQVKAQGKVRAFGISVNNPIDGLMAIDNLLPDAIQVNFNLLDQRILECGLLEHARIHHVSLIARTPLCFGFLSGGNNETVFSSSDHRSRWPQEQIDTWVTAAEKMNICRENHSESNPVQFALRFCLTYPEISVVIPGMMSEKEVLENITASKHGSLDAQTLSCIAEIYINETCLMNYKLKSRVKIH